MAEAKAGAEAKGAGPTYVYLIREGELTIAFSAQVEAEKFAQHCDMRIETVTVDEHAPMTKRNLLPWVATVAVGNALGMARPIIYYSELGSIGRVGYSARAFCGTDNEGTIAVYGPAAVVYLWATDKEDAKKRAREMAKELIDSHKYEAHNYTRRPA